MKMDLAYAKRVVCRGVAFATLGHWSAFNALRRISDKVPIRKSGMTNRNSEHERPEVNLPFVV
jgi:hypothetical protein